MNLGWDCRSLGPGVLMLLTFALRIRGAGGAGISLVFSSLDGSEGRGATSRVCLQERDGCTCPGESPLAEFLGAGKPPSIPKAGSVLLCVYPYKRMCVCV